MSSLLSAHHFIQQQQTQLVRAQQSQSTANNSNLNMAAPENNQNISVSLSTSSSHQMSTKSEDNSQNNSRGHKPSRSITPTADGAKAGSNYSLGPPKQDQTTAEQEEASQKIYCEFALKIAKLYCRPLSSSTKPPPTKETTSEATEPHTTTSTATKSAEIGDVSLEEGEIKENEEDEALAAAGRAKNDYEQQLALVASLRTAEMWSPENPQGRMCYSRDFMNALRELPLSKQRFEFSTVN